MSKQFYVYIVTNKRCTALYTGVTNDLRRRVYEHKSEVGGAFAAKYKTHNLVYYEVFEDPESAILREKRIKGGSRQKRINLVNDFNPQWADLYNTL